MNNEEQSKNQIKKHNIILENRKTLNVSGVKDVSEFDDGKVIITTNNGLLTVDGEGLHINSFSQQTGDLDLEGRVHSLIYNDEPAKDGNFFSRIFK